MNKVLILLILLALTISGCKSMPGDKTAMINTSKKALNTDLNGENMGFKVNKTDDEWRKELTPEQYRVLREKGTEPAFTGAFTDKTDEGTYVCAACGAKLFSSDTKFHSGCGWPSYFAPLLAGNIVEQTDTTYGMVRTEILCASCGSHLGHVFEDGPPPTGLRYCVNSVSMKFIPKDSLSDSKNK